MPVARRFVGVQPLAITRYGPVYAGDWIRVSTRVGWFTARSLGRLADGRRALNCVGRSGLYRAFPLGDVSRVAPASPHPPGVTPGRHR